MANCGYCGRPVHGLPVHFGGKNYHMACFKALAREQRVFGEDVLETIFS